MMPKGDLANGPSELEGGVQEAHSSPSDALDALKHTNNSNLTSTSTNELYANNGAYLSDKAASNDLHNNDVTMSDSTSNYDNGSLVDECNYQHTSGKFCCDYVTFINYRK